jgi:hypothetical protein
VTNPHFKKKERNKMEIGNCRLRLNKVGSDIPINNVTPAELLVLHVLHQGNNGGSSYGEDMDKITVTGEAKSLVNSTIARTDNEELRRLLGKYTAQNKKGDKIVKLIWPGMDVKLPKTFKEIKWSEIEFDGVEVAPINIATGTPVMTTPIITTPLQ